MQNFEPALPRVLNQLHERWQISAGGVDLFAVTLANGAPNGAREHLCRLAPGQLLRGLGLPGAAADSDFGLLAVALPGTFLRTFDETDELSLAGLTDDWLVALTSSIRRARPRQFHEAQRGATLVLQAKDAVYPMHGVVWLNSDAADLTWQPAQRRLPAGVALALTPTTWATAHVDGVFVCQDSAALGAGLEPALVCFHAALLEYLRERQGFKDAAVTQRLFKKREADDKLVRAGIGSLADVLHTPDQRISAFAHTDDPLLGACQMVLQAVGINAVLHRFDAGAGLQQQVEQVARQARLVYRRVRLDAPGWWRTDSGPLLVFRLHDRHPLALLPVPAGGYLVADPHTGARQKLDSVLAAQIDPSGFMFFRSLPNRVLGLADLLRFALAGGGRDRRTMWGAGALGGLLALAIPFTTGVLIDEVIPGAQLGQLQQLMLMLVCVVFAGGAFELTRSLALLRIDGRSGNALHTAVIARLLHLPTGFFRAFSAGDLTQRALGISAVLQFINNTVQSVLLSWIFGLFSYAYLFSVSPPLALIATLLVLAAMVFSTVINIWRLGFERRISALDGKIASRVFQILNGIAKIRASGAENRVFALWATAFAGKKDVQMQSGRVGNLQPVFDAAFSVLCPMILFGAVAGFMPDMTTGRFIAFNAAFMHFFVSTLALTGMLSEAMGVVALYERARPLLDAVPEVSDGQGAPGELWGGIELSHVGFHFSADGPAILQDLSIQIRPGEFIAFVGPSGAGKSTLFRLLLGFEKPSSGVVSYDGKDLAGLDVTAVRQQLGVVLQSGRLMPGDIFTNIVGSAPLSLEDAWEAARMAGLSDDIAAMPMGMHTVIAEGAGTISGGQKQRLMVARAIVRKPRILLFDEATSALDNQSQAIVANSIAGLNATRIVIAHRLSTIMRADRIYFIEAGQVIEAGSYDQLMAQGGRFFAMAQRQLV